MASLERDSELANSPIYGIYVSNSTTETKRTLICTLTCTILRWFETFDEVGCPMVVIL